jgi:hypothetical protein
LKPGGDAQGKVFATKVTSAKGEKGANLIVSIDLATITR